MKTSEKIDTIAVALHKATQNINNIVPNKQGYNYKYADLAEIIDKSKPQLLENGLFIIQSVSRSERSVAITTRIQHISGQFFEDTFDLPSTDMKSVNAVQAIGASITYGRRYAIAAMLGIAVDEDTDGKTKQKQENSIKPTLPVISKIITGLENAKDNDLELELKLKFWNDYKSQYTEQEQIKVDEFIKEVIK